MPCAWYTAIVWCCMMQKGPSRGRYDFPGQEITAISQDAGETGPSAPLWTAVGSGDAGPWPGGAVQRRCADIHRGAAAGQNFYLLTDSGVECFSLAGERLWGQPTPNRPQGLLPAKEGVLLLSRSCFCPAACPAPAGRKHIKGPLSCSRIRPFFSGISYAQWSGWCWRRGMPARGCWPPSSS